MENRINIQQVEPAGYKSLFPIEKFLSTTKLSVTHKNLIKVRASQINGCAFCINRHTREARRDGESEKRLYLLDAWREANIYTDDERAILAITEEVTLISQHVSDATYMAASKIFDQQYLAQVILAIIAINCWNRIAITTQLQPEE